VSAYTGVSEAERPQSQVGCGVRDAAETELDSPDGLMYDNVLSAKLQTHRHTTVAISTCSHTHTDRQRCTQHDHNKLVKLTYH